MEDCQCFQVAAATKFPLQSNKKIVLAPLSLTDTETTIQRCS